VLTGKRDFFIRDIAQLGRAPALGAGCRRFKSYYPDIFLPYNAMAFLILALFCQSSLPPVEKYADPEVLERPDPTYLIVINVEEIIEIMCLLDLFLILRIISLGDLVKLLMI
jgi:hypothetical protein